MSPALEMKGVSRRYSLPRRHLWGARPSLTAVDGVDLSIASGEALGLIGESGSGKSTLARLAVALEPPDAGCVRVAGVDWAELDANAKRRARAACQMIFQDPMGSLDPRRSAGWTVAEPLLALRLSRADREKRAARALADVGLAGASQRYPHEFSGGQRQRIAIARAIVVEPKLIVADEAVSALDVSVQAQILNLLMEAQDQTNAAMLFVSHDLAAVSAICDRVAVMAEGRIVATGGASELLGPAQAGAKSVRRQGFDDQSVDLHPR